MTTQIETKTTTATATYERPGPRRRRRPTCRASDSSGCEAALSEGAAPREALAGARTTAFVPIGASLTAPNRRCQTDAHVRPRKFCPTRRRPAATGAPTSVERRACGCRLLDEL